MNEACSRTRRKQFRDPNRKAVRDLQLIATAFVELQQHRQTADYDNSKKWTGTEVLEQIESAQAAFDCWSVISHEEIAQDFLLQLMVPR